MCPYLLFLFPSKPFTFTFCNVLCICCLQMHNKLPKTQYLKTAQFLQVRNQGITAQMYPLLRLFHRFSSEGSTVKICIHTSGCQPNAIPCGGGRHPHAKGCPQLPAMWPFSIGRVFASSRLTEESLTPFCYYRVIHNINIIIGATFHHLCNITYSRDVMRMRHSGSQFRMCVYQTVTIIIW